MMSGKISNKDLSGPDKKSVSFSIKSKMLVYFGSIFIITMAIFILSGIFGVPFTNFRGEYKQHQSEVFKNLNMVADLKKERLLNWLEEREDDARVLSRSSLIKSSVASLLPVIKENIANGAKENSLLTRLQKDKHWQTLTQHLNLVKSEYAVYYRIQIADALTGTIMASTDNEELGMDLSRHDSFNTVLHPGYNELMDFKKDPSGGSLELFITHGIASYDGDDNVSAVLIMHINPDDFITPLLHTGEGLGRTGEALLVNQNTEIITRLKYPLANGTKARPLEYQIKAKPAVLAARGHEGIITAEDYRGKTVLAAFRHIRISPELGWGLVVKRDQAEVYTPLHESVYYLIFIGVICAVIMLGLVVVISRNLSRPVSLLSSAVQQVQAGNLNIRTQINTSDELGILSSGLNSMIQQIQNWDKELKEKVKDRTKEISEVNEKLKVEITERKQMEESLQYERGFTEYIVSTAPYLICGITPDGTTVFVNEAVLKITGYTREEIMLKNWWKVFYPDEEYGQVEQLFKNLRSGQVADYEMILTTKNNEKRTISWNSINRYDKHRKLLEVVGIGYDITERKQNEQELDEYRKRLEGLVEERTGEIKGKTDKLEKSEKALLHLLEDVNEIRDNLQKANTKLKELDRLKSMFIASMSHELRTPLNSIIGFTGVILQGMDGKINPQQKDHLGRANRSATHLLALINDIIDLSKVEAGKVDVFMEDIVLGEVINEAVDDVRLQANEKRLALDVSVPQGVRVNTDRKRLYQCLLNYLSNAVKFTESGTISIAAHETNGEVEIIVSDTGIGISKEDQQRLFKPFVRIDSHLRTKTLGTGLGLYLTRKLITEMLGGTTEVQSQPGKGSTFTLRLPKEIKQG